LLVAPGGKPLVRELVTKPVRVQSFDTRLLAAALHHLADPTVGHRSLAAALCVRLT
jgi:hypothetical protein